MRKNSAKLPVKNKKGRLTEKSMSFHGRASEDDVVMLSRPRTVPDLISRRSVVVTTETTVRSPKLTKLLLNVTVRGSFGPVQVLISPESTVGEVIAAALRQYCKEGRRPILQSVDPSRFDLHYSQFSLERLCVDEKLIELGSRNFFLCPKQPAAVTGIGGGGAVTAAVAATAASCSEEAGKLTKGVAVWHRLMEFML